MKSVEEHYAEVMSLGAPLTPRPVAVTSARGLVLAHDTRALVSIPAFTNSAMDGFAVRADDVVVGKEIPVRGDIAAGETDAAVLEPGTALRIMTGAPLPTGADAILQVELTEDAGANMRTESPTSIIPTETVRTGLHVRHAGEDIQAGDTAFAAGTALSPAHISALVAMGHAEVPVHPRARVGVLTTGAELRASGESLGAGQIFDSNGPLVAQLAEERGATTVSRAIHTDNVDDFLRQLAELAEHVDLIVTTGGVSAGAFDVVKAALLAEGVQFVKVAMQPGKPQGYGTVADTGGRRIPIVCLPGNPVSVFVSMQLFGLPLIDALMGRPVRELSERFVPETVGKGWHRQAGRVQFMPCRRDDDGAIAPASSGGSGSHLIGSLPWATGLARIEADVAEVGAGETIPVLWLNVDRWLSETAG